MYNSNLYTIFYDLQTHGFFNGTRGEVVLYINNVQRGNMCRKREGQAGANFNERACFYGMDVL